MKEKSLEHFPNNVGITYWTRLPIKDTYKWINGHTIPRYSLAPVPGTFFLFKSDYTLAESSMIRLGLGAIKPEQPNLVEALDALEAALADAD